MIKKFTVSGEFSCTQQEFLHYPEVAYKRLLEKIDNSSKDFYNKFGFKAEELFLSNFSIALIARVNGLSFKPSDDNVFWGYRLRQYSVDGTEFVLATDCEFITEWEVKPYEEYRGY